MEMTKEQVADNITKLVRARKLIEEVMETLDKGTHQCPECHSVKSNDQQQRAGWEMLNAAQDRVGRVKNMLVNDSLPTSEPP